MLGFVMTWTLLFIAIETVPGYKPPRSYSQLPSYRALLYCLLTIFYSIRPYSRVFTVYRHFDDDFRASNLFRGMIIDRHEILHRGRRWIEGICRARKR